VKPAAKRGELRAGQVFRYRARGRARYLRIVAVRPDPGMVLVCAARRDGRALGGKHAAGPLRGLPRATSYPQYLSWRNGRLVMPAGYELVAIGGRR
jgi:hypothetical protein